MIAASCRSGARAHRRAHVTWNATYQRSSGWCDNGTILDASPTGVFLRAPGDGIHIGEDLSLRCRPGFHQPGARDQTFDLVGTVRWVGFSSRHGCEGAGIQLSEINPTLVTNLPSVHDAEPALVPAEISASLTDSLWAPDDTEPRPYDVMVVSADPAVQRAVLASTDVHPCFSARCVSQGKAALESALDRPPDLMVIDLELPDMDGRDVLNRLHREGITARAVVIATSYRDAQFDRLATFELGATEYEVKPLHPGRLFRKMEFLLEKRDGLAN